MVAEYYKKKFSLETLRRKCYITREGVSFLGLSEAADSLGFRTIGVKIPFSKLEENVPLPCIVHWRQRHFVVVYKISGDKIWIADPANGLLKIDRKEFLTNWSAGVADGERIGLVLILDPTPALYDKEDDSGKNGSFRFLWKYFRLYRKYINQLVLGLLMGSLIQLIIPFLTQSIIDIGINNDNIGFIYLILFAQLALVIGRLSVEFIRSWLLLHIGA
jgi:ATP-binding cassette subfamily B protein